MRVFRQGDVVIREVEGLPEGVVTGEDDKLEMSGETGQLHRVAVQTIEIDWNKFIVVPEGGAVMTHLEHPPLALPPMVAKVERVRSITPYLD